MLYKLVFIGFSTAILMASVVTAGVVTIDVVPVGNPGNAGEWAGEDHGGDGPNRVCGAVDRTYWIGKYEVTAGQYTEFLNAKATIGNPYGLYNASMWSASSGCKISCSGSGTVLDPYVYGVADDYANRPVNYVSFWDAARFTNWLNNGQGDGDTETGAYTLNGYNDTDGHNISRNTGATWFLPSEDEWYKAAYHKNDGVTGNYWDYPTGVDMPTTPGRDMSESTNSGNNANYLGSPYPINSPYYTTLVGEFQLSDSPYGTFDQGGNVWEWNQDVVVIGGTTAARGMRGGLFGLDSYYMTAADRGYCRPIGETDGYGFRVASSVPEPDGLTLILFGVVATLAYLGQRRGRTARITGRLVF